MLDDIVTGTGGYFTVISNRDELRVFGQRLASSECGFIGKRRVATVIGGSLVLDDGSMRSLADCSHEATPGPSDAIHPRVALVGTSEVARWNDGQIAMPGVSAVSLPKGQTEVTGLAPGMAATYGEGGATLLFVE